MLITKEQQEAWVAIYAKNHTLDEVVGFVDGINKALEVVQKGLEPKKTSNMHPTLADALKPFGIK